MYLCSVFAILYLHSFPTRRSSDLLVFKELRRLLEIPYRFAVIAFLKRKLTKAIKSISRIFLSSFPELSSEALLSSAFDGYINIAIPGLKVTAVGFEALE